MAKYQGIKTLEVLQGAENYNNWIANRISDYIKSPAMEIGAGTGNISSQFINLKEFVVTDFDNDLVRNLKEKFKSYPNIRVDFLDVSSATTRNKRLFNTIFSVNVLEHIEDDIHALKNIHRMLNESGRVILLVPAKKFAFKKIDENLGHFRRYEKKELIDKLKSAGFKIDEIEYFNILGLISWLVRDLISNKHTDLKPSQVKLFDLLVPLLKMVEPKRGLPIGISLFVVGTRV